MKREILDYRSTPVEEPSPVGGFSRFDYPVGIALSVVAVAASLCASAILFKPMTNAGLNNSDSYLLVFLVALPLMLWTLISTLIVVLIASGKSPRQWRRNQRIAIVAPHIAAILLPIAVTLIFGNSY